MFSGIGDLDYGWDAMLFGRIRNNLRESFIGSTIVFTEAIEECLILLI